MCSYFVCLADNAEQERQARERLLMYLRAVSPAFPGDRSKAPPHIAYFADIVDRIHAMEPSDLGERSIVTGTPTRVIDHLHQVEDAGIEEVICYFSYGALPHGEVLQQMERFSAEVMPAFGDGRVWAGTATAAVSS
jgi:alkanesulfonate monooxygenase SsuD/methylene tetrahydromethanopterin reductase-like flavin-dependent oxidoreductase (luciferase family)